MTGEIVNENRATKGDNMVKCVGAIFYLRCIEDIQKGLSIVCSTLPGSLYNYSIIPRPHITTACSVNMIMANHCSVLPQPLAFFFSL